MELIIKTDYNDKDGSVTIAFIYDAKLVNTITLSGEETNALIEALAETVSSRESKAGKIIHLNLN